MEYKLQSAAPQPTVQYGVRDLEGQRQWIVIFSGVVNVAPAQQRGVVVRTTVEQPGMPIGFYVPEAFGLPLEGAVVAAEVSLARVIVDGRTQVATAYGVSDVAVRLVEADKTPGMGWPYLSFTCHSQDLALGVQYRVTVHHPLQRPVG
jgi:hypothetical protein